MENVRTQLSLSEPEFLKVRLSEIPAEKFVLIACTTVYVYYCAWISTRFDRQPSLTSVQELSFQTRIQDFEMGVEFL